MLRKIKRLFIVKTRFEAYAVIYALALGSAERGSAYLHMIPGWPGQMLFAAASGAVVLGGAKILDAIRLERENAELRAQLTERA